VQHTPLERVDAGESPQDVVGTHGHVEVDAAIPDEEVQPVVAGHIERVHEVARRIEQDSDRPARLRVRTEELADLIHLIDSTPVAQPWPIATAPCHLVVRELQRAAEIAGQILHVIAPSEHPHRLGDGREHIVATTRHCDETFRWLRQSHSTCETLVSRQSANRHRLPTRTNLGKLGDEGPRSIAIEHASLPGRLRS